MRSYGLRFAASAAALAGGLLIAPPLHAQRNTQPDDTPAVERQQREQRNEATDTNRSANQQQQTRSAAGSNESQNLFASLGTQERREVQQTLQQRGYYEGNIDGLYGPATRQALMDYQRAEQLPITGHVDRTTLRQMGIDADEVQRVRGMRDENVPRAAGDDAAIPIEDRGPQVREAQQALQREGFHRGAVDGLLGPTTADSIRAFQQSRGLAVTGDLTQDTLRALGIAAGASPQRAARDDQSAENQQPRARAEQETERPRGAREPSPGEARRGQAQGR